MLQAKEVTQILRAHGYKVTPQRLAVYHALARTTAHPQAETLYAELLPLYPTMSLATVYKTLGILCEVGLAQELNVGEDAYRYDFSYGGNQYSLWYDDENLVKISATFYSTDEEGQSTSETYLATFSNYRFGETEREPFLRPQESTEAIYAESPISFEDWMTILDRFGSRAASWLD